MYDRTLQWPKNTSFLFGPRGTGKSTWIRNSKVNAFVVNLLDTSLALRFEKDPRSFRELILAEASPSQWIVVDEVQRVPALLDQIHLCIEEDGFRKFLLTGSSARKLRKSSANLLGGRARRLSFFTLTNEETGFAVPSEEQLLFGLLPEAVSESDATEKELYLKGYVENYLIDEIKRESQLRNLSGFQRFLEVAAICSGSPLSLTGIARDAQVSRESVRSYFEVLEDTLIGETLPAFRARLKVKEVAAPKFYFFDPGVLNACAGYFSEPAPSDWKGILFETLVFHELRAYLSLHRKKGKLFYWRTPSGSEVDFVWKHGETYVLIEVKAASRFKRSFLTGLKSFQSEKPTARSIIVYLGPDSLLVEGTEVFPLRRFLEKLYAHELLG